MQLSSSHCSLSTPFNVLADSGGIWLYRGDGLPREIFFHAGELSVDHQLQQISADDAQRLQAMETQARQLMPQVAGIAHDVIDLSYDALGGVVEVMTGSWLNARKIERLRKRASVYVDDTLGKGRWDQQAFDGNFERYVEQEAEAFKGSIGRHLMWQIMTGRADGIDQRAQAMDGQLDAKLDARAATIDVKADALCTQVQSLRRLQDALQYRYQGKPLQMLTPLHEDTSAKAAEAATTTPHSSDATTDTAIEVQQAHHN
ncbi:DUF2884 family protein [Xanthomonas campestris pv. campestris]|nr:DUF2884 family protein [Xanthomonas campestris pv. campestris]